MRVGAQGWDWMDKVICAGPMGSWDFHTASPPHLTHSLVVFLRFIHLFICPF